ncbi:MULTISPECIES: hypothetical protein [unclassified Nitrospina]|uniref:hypothetical protein n=1 Tax=unclassified Nitrospina TaxID=2638683 RepID=UPI003F97DCA7
MTQLADRFKREPFNLSDRKIKEIQIANIRRELEMALVTIKFSDLLDDRYQEMNALFSNIKMSDQALRPFGDKQFTYDGLRGPINQTEINRFVEEIPEDEVMPLWDVLRPVLYRLRKEMAAQVEAYKNKKANAPAHNF